ncbi:MAG TPA: peptidase M1 [Microscillaceae bacterium]|jgi:hypothetical protein|nr:peptidase M1 [Microscillaceae bacterium]
MKKTSTFLVLLLGFIPWVALAQLPNNQSLFEPNYPRLSTPYRSALGVPGETYWQNRADYVIQAQLDEQSHSLSGSVVISYTNNSPMDLPFVWVQMDQNRYKVDARGAWLTSNEGGRYVGATDGGYEVKAVKINLQGQGWVDAKYVIEDTRMQLQLPSNLAAKGGQLQIQIDYGFKIPQYGSDRMGRLSTKNGWVYSMAQWYPRVAVFDDVKGWNNEPYLGAGEFYCEYGDFEYQITVPYDHIVVASGELQNPQEVLTSEHVDLLEKAKNSDKTVVLVDKNSVANAKQTRPTQSGTQTWRFKMQNTRDVAFASSKAFLWDAAAINLPSGRKALAMSVYPIESSGDKAWGRSTEYTKAAIEHYSATWFEYPYAVAANVACEVGGMEYPGVSFCSWQSTGEGLWGVTDHEFGHNWFPMIVGSNERLYPWMDEGFNTFINHYSTLNFNKGEYKSYLASARLFTFYLTNPNREGIHTYPDVVQQDNLGWTAYFKPAIGLFMLREVVLGAERFDFAFRHYIKNWAYKHPTPADFFNCMENAAGENLSWFWNSWFYSNANLDQAIVSVDAVNTQEKKGITVTLKNNQPVIMPVVLEIIDTKNNKNRIKLPAEIWQKGDVFTFFYSSNEAIKSLKIDPDNILPDIDAGNNVWNAK